MISVFKRLFVVLALGIALAMAGLTAPASAATSTAAGSTVTNVAPATPKPPKPPKPGKNCKWVPASKTWHPGHKVWVKPYLSWHKAYKTWHPGYKKNGKWHKGYWVHHKGYWQWHSGHWKWVPGYWVHHKGHWQCPKPCNKKKDPYHCPPPSYSAHTVSKNQVKNGSFALRSGSTAGAPDRSADLVLLLGFGLVLAGISSVVVNRRLRRTEN
jgi:hypothetical protein